MIETIEPPRRIARFVRVAALIKIGAEVIKISAEIGLCRNATGERGRLRIDRAVSDQRTLMNGRTFTRGLLIGADRCGSSAWPMQTDDGRPARPR